MLLFSLDLAPIVSFLCKFPSRKPIVIFDDYEWESYRDQPRMHPKLGVDSFLATFQDRVRILYRGYQVIGEKIG